MARRAAEPVSPSAAVSSACCTSSGRLRAPTIEPSCSNQLAPEPPAANDVSFTSAASRASLRSATDDSAAARIQVSPASRSAILANAATTRGSFDSPSVKAT